MALDVPRVLRELLARLSLIQAYTGTSLFELEGVQLRSADLDVLIHVWEGGAQTFALKEGGQVRHLNYWSARDLVGDQDPITAMWACFWTQEGVNRDLGRLQWMHGPDLPVLSRVAAPKAPPPFEEDIFTLFG
jgi:hypothetical protein